MGLEFCPECKKMHYTTNPCAQVLAKRSGVVSRRGTKFVAEVPEGTRLVAFAGEVIAAGPNTPASNVTESGLVPIASSPSGKASGFGPDTAGSNPAEATTKRPGRPRIHPDRKAYKAEHERRRRAAAKTTTVKTGD